MFAVIVAGLDAFNSMKLATYLIDVLCWLRVLENASTFAHVEQHLDEFMTNA
eukprot:m.1679158 g.1679158  ORF g.1679158 m.1679158 type:complete len:52 (+) comp212866_c0_seq1:89-244(+)